MRILFTKHALEKQEILKGFGWNITLKFVENTIKSPSSTGTTKRYQPIALKKLDAKHLLRVVYERKNDIITVITFHPTRKGRYGT